MTDLWQPRSTCGYDCLPAAAPASVAGALLVLWRLVATTVVLLIGGVALPLLAALPAALPRNRRLVAQRAFARSVLWTLGIRHRVLGRVPERRALLVANHVSWIDTLIVLAHTPARLLAKHEVGDWAIIGRVARTLGTVFVDRTRPKALPATVGRVADVLAGGGVVAVFPEGTTWCGRSAGRFRPAMFQAAIDAGVPVVPVRLSFTIADEPTTVAAFLGEDTLYASVRRVVAARDLTVTLRTYPMLHPTHNGERSTARRTLARAAAAVLLRQPAAMPVPLLPAPPLLPPLLRPRLRHYFGEVVAKERWEATTSGK
jgi:1-acyl-sn-glycerol-3-phosphate acyltransferase